MTAAIHIQRERWRPAIGTATERHPGSGESNLRRPKDRYSEYRYFETSGSSMFDASMMVKPVPMLTGIEFPVR